MNLCVQPSSRKNNDDHTVDAARKIKFLGGGEDKKKRDKCNRLMNS